MECFPNLVDWFHVSIWVRAGTEIAFGTGQEKSRLSRPGFQLQAEAQDRNCELCFSKSPSAGSLRRPCYRQRANRKEEARQNVFVASTIFELYLSQYATYIYEFLCYLFEIPSCFPSMFWLWAVNEQNERFTQLLWWRVGLVCAPTDFRISRATANEMTLKKKKRHTLVSDSNKFKSAKRIEVPVATADDALVLSQTPP